MPDIYAFLDELGIAYERCDHPAVFTVSEVHQLVPPLRGAHTKNLFLRDKKGRQHVLVVVASDKQVDIKSLSGMLGLGHLSFGSPERLHKYLGIEPGSVTLLALLNDANHEVAVFIDRDLWDADALQCHPLVNTATLVIARDGIERFLRATGHPYQLVEVPVDAGRAIPDAHRGSGEAT
ncbi:MAG: prolyl-tRNA synthetase associated domain-containing protein [Gemmatimonadaceae bacterium]|nr:prolyl-tRNA synthetase associated domain-containing protein [Gemmatimonadaceae bacterium]